MSLTTEQIMRLIAQQVPAMARRSVPVPSTRLGSVAATSDPTVAYVEVLVDGDDSSISVLNATGVVLAQGQRVVVSFYPPHGAMVTGLLAPTSLAEQFWTTTYDVTSSTVTSTSSTSWTSIGPAGVGWHDSGGDLVCDVGGSWELDLQAQWSSSGVGTHRAAAMADAGSVHRVDVSHQFTGPGGVPTTGYGLSSSGLDLHDALEADTLTGIARQDSGGDLAVRLVLRLRLLGPTV